jgi:hypothetical protein
MKLWPKSNTWVGSAILKTKQEHNTSALKTSRKVPKTYLECPKWQQDLAFRCSGVQSDDVPTDTRRYIAIIQQNNGEKTKHCKMCRALDEDEVTAHAWVGRHLVELDCPVQCCHLPAILGTTHTTKQFNT